MRLQTQSVETNHDIQKVCIHQWIQQVRNSLSICKRRSENSSLSSIKQENEKLNDGWQSKKNCEENEIKNERSIENQLSSNIL